MRPQSVKPRWRLLEALLLAVIVTAGSFFVFVMAQRVEERMQRLKEQVVAMLEQELGRQISYESISPSVFGYLAVRDFALYSFDDPQQVLLRVNRLKIYYNILRFLATKDPVRSLTEIQIAGSQLNVDHDLDRELIDLARSLLEGSPGAGPALGEGLPLTLSGTNITLNYRKGAQELRVSELFFSLSSAAPRYRVSVRASVEALFEDPAGGLLSGEFGSPPAEGLARPAQGPGGGRAAGELLGGRAAGELRRLQTRLKATGWVDHSFERSDLAVKIYSLTTGDLSLRRQTFQLVSDERELQVRKIQDRAPLDLQLVLDRAGGDLSFRFVAEDFRPASLVEFSGELARYGSLLAGSFTGQGSVTYNLNYGTLDYATELQVALPAGLLPFAATFRTNLRGDDRIVFVDPLYLEAPLGRLEFVGSLLTANLLPEGRLKVYDLQAVEGKSVSTTLLLHREGQSLSAEGSELEFGGVVFTDVGLLLVPEERGFTFELSTSLADGDAPGLLAASGSFRLAPKPELAVSASFDRLPPAAIAALTAPPGEIGALLASRLRPYTLSLKGELWTDFERFTVSSPGIELEARDSPERRMRFALEASDELVRVEDLELQWDDYRLTGLLNINIAGEGTTAHSLVWIQGVPYELEASYAPGGRMFLRGSYGLEASLQTSGVADPSLFPTPLVPLTGTSFSVRAASIPVPLPAGTIRVSLDVVGIYTGAGRLIVRGESCEVRDLPLPTLGPNSTRFGFLLQDRELRIDGIRHTDRVSSVEGAGGVVLEELSPLSGAARLELADAAGSERYLLAVDLREGALEGLAQFDRAPLERLGDLAVSGDAAGTVTARGTLQDPVLQVQVALQDGRLNVDPLELRLAGQVSKQRLRLDSLDLELLSHRLEGASGTVDLEGGGFSLTAPYRADYFGQDVRLSAVLEGTIADPDALLQGNSPLAAGIDGSLRMRDIRVQGEGRPEWLLRLSARDGTLSVDGGVREGVDATIGEDGSFSVVMQHPLPVRGTARGRMRQGRIESTLDIESLDMRVIPALTPIDDIWNFEAGVARGRVQIAGPVNDPDWNGRMDVSGLLMSIKLSPDLVGPADGTLYFEEKTFYFPRITTTTGQGTIEAEGVFYLDHWVPSAVELSLYLDKPPGAHIQYTFGPIFVDGYGIGAVRITSDDNFASVQGKVQALNARVALERQELSEPGPPPDVPPIPLVVDMRIQTGRGVEFFWPAMNFPVVHSYVKQGGDIHVYLDESTDELVIEGEAEMRGGEVFYFDRSFYLKEGSITFEDTIGDIDPWIHALAEVRERDMDNEEVRIYLEANNRLSQFSPRFYSEPARADVEILDMIGGTILNRFEESDFGTAAVMLTSDIVGQFGILTPFERAVREVLRLDLFSIRTQFLQNVLFGKILGQDSALATVNPLDNTTLSLGKYLGTDLFLEALIRFQAVNEIDAASNIRTEGELSLEWATPFFLLEWTFTPLHPESLFLADNSIGLSWKLSY